MSQCKPATKRELAWCDRLEKILKAHPPGLWLFAGALLFETMDGREIILLVTEIDEITD